MPREQQPSNHHHRVSSQCDELNHLSDAALLGLLRRYTLTDVQLAHLGYPIAHTDLPGYAVIVNHQQHPIWNRTRKQDHKLNANARVFVPGSNSSSNSATNATHLRAVEFDSGNRSRTAAVEISCVRCHQSFYINQEDGKYIVEEKCLYHWGKLRNCDDRGQCVKWECCQGTEESQGCTNARTHVWSGVTAAYNAPLDGYVKTKPSQVFAQDGNYGAYALDCEMCYTQRGLVLAKVTLVGMDGRIVYDTHVKPDDEVIDYNTRFSGITANDLAKAMKNIRDVQKDIALFVNAETILIGHGLENDLRALKLLHTTVIDTCNVFPHFLGYPYRRSLKTLARTVLKREIQVTGHDSVEDARIAFDLLLRKLQQDLY